MARKEVRQVKTKRGGLLDASPTRRDFMRTIGMGAAAVGATTLAAACAPVAAPASEATDSAAPASSVLRVAFGGPSEQMRAGAFNNPFPRPWVSLTRNKLVRQGVNLDLEGDLLEGWEPSPDGKSYTLHVRPGVKWHDGEGFSARDVEFFLRRVVDKRASFAVAGFLVVKGAQGKYEGDPESLASDTLEGVEVVDDLTVRVDLETAYTPFPSELAHWGAGLGGPEHILRDVAPEDIPSHSVSTSDPVGTGPFKFADFQPNEFIELHRNDDYYRGRPSIEKIFSVGGNEDTLTLMMQNGELDLWQINLSGISIETLQAVQEMPHIEIVDFGSANYHAWEVCVDPEVCDPWVGPKELRQAMMYSLDREALNKTFLAGLGGLINTHPMPAGWQDAPDLNEYPYDPDKARELLSQLNWDADREIPATLPTGRGFRVRLAEACQQMWAEVGLKVKLQQVESGISQFKDPGIYGIVQSGMESGLDPNYMFTYYSHVLPPECCNHPRFVNDEAIGYLQTGQQEFDKDKRQEAYHGLQRLLNDELPRLWLFKVPMLFAKSRKLQNVHMTPHYGSYSWDPVVNAEEWTLES